jgi:hypothetical protein
MITWKRTKGTEGVIRYCFWLPLRYLLSFFMWSLYYFYSHLLLLITPSVPFVLFHVIIVLFLLTFTASDYPFGTFCPFSCGHCIIFTHIYCFWLPLQYLLVFFMWLLFYFYSHLLLLITPSVPFCLFHVVIVLFLLTFTWVKIIQWPHEKDQKVPKG